MQDGGDLALMNDEGGGDASDAGRHQPAFGEGGIFIGAVIGHLEDEILAVFGEEGLRRRGLIPDVDGEHLHLVFVFLGELVEMGQ